jgi:hypothetical protein
MSFLLNAAPTAARVLAAKHAAGEALARWMQRYAAFIATKRGLATALHSGNPAFDTLPAYFEKRLRPALRTLLDTAAAAGEVRADIEPDELLRAVLMSVSRTHTKTVAPTATRAAHTEATRLAHR